MNHKAAARAISEILSDPVIPHLDHSWEQREAVVFCTPCDVELYEGQLPIGERRA